ncbi:hypothetical protein [Streptomyces sp. NBC_01744]|uniref:hypothetical protein n=1 Tax=Streptomyces sp. NBC_01744 TaxID=2975927 RepID=UPI003D9A855B
MAAANDGLVQAVLVHPPSVDHRCPQGSDLAARAGAIADCCFGVSCEAEAGRIDGAAVSATDHKGYAPCSMRASTSNRRRSRMPAASNERASSGMTVMSVPCCLISAAPLGLSASGLNPMIGR